MTPIQLYINTLQKQLINMPDGYVKETVEACLRLAEGIKESYENTYYDSCQSADQN
mgnify:CR=1 FL=1|jgi:hypothetical protein